MINIPHLSAFIQKHHYFSRFLAVGVFNTALDFLLFFVFANLLSIYSVVASIFSTGVVMCISFFLNHHFVFRSNKQKRQTVIRFFAATLFNVWVVQSLIIFLVISIFNTSSIFATHKWTLNLFAKLCGICVSFVLNFVMYRYIFHNESAETITAV